MIVTRMDGGLGNQMFQYAYGLYLASQHRTELALDLNSYQTGPQHGYMLDRFQITGKPLNSQLNQRLPQRYRAQPAKTSIAWLPNNLPDWNLPDWLRPSVFRRVKERPFGFNKKYLKASDDSYLVGYWQSEKFFPGLRDELLKQFTPKLKLSDASLLAIELMQTVPSVSLHIRRGDYLTHAETARIYEQLSLDYYHASLQRFAAEHERVQVFVFSNDLPWCREQLRLNLPTHFMDHTQSLSAHEDLIMMSHAACNVIANSTFSWWGAYLNNRSDRTTFAPARWFCPGTLDDSHLSSPAWQLVAGSQSTRQRAA